MAFAALAPIDAVQGQKTKDWGTAVSGLQMSITVGRINADSPIHSEFDAEFRNDTHADIAVMTGEIIGTTPYTSSIKLFLTDSHGHLQILDGSFFGAGIAGSFGYASAIVPAHGSHTVQVNLAQYRKSSSHEAPDVETGTYTMQAVFTEDTLDPKFISGMLKPGKYWVGTLKSNQLKFQFPPP